MSRASCSNEITASALGPHARLMHETGTPSKQLVVIGAGPAGLTAAYELTLLNVPVVVLEKGDIVGGLSRTITYKGYYFDMGGHRFFTKSSRVQAMWRNVLADDLLRRPRLSRIYYKGKFFRYPLKPGNVVSGLGLIESTLVLLSYLKWQLFPHHEEETFEQWVTNRFGKRLFLTFFKTYTEKVWGIPCSELKAEWAAQRIKNLSIKTILLSTIVKPRNTIVTLIEEFDYPRLGPGMMWNAVRERIEGRQGRVLLNADVVRINREENRIVSVTVLRDGIQETFAGTDFISSIPITDLIRKIEPPAPLEVLGSANKLTYRDFLTVCLIVNKRDLFPDNWIYVHDPTVKVGRIQNFKNWSPDMVPDPGKSSLGIEYFCTREDEIWTTSDAELIELAKREIEQIGLASAGDVEDGCVVRVEKAYPIYDSDYAEYLARVRQYVVCLQNLQTIGRNGLHRYNNQDHAMLSGMYAVANLFDVHKRDLWTINTDQEYNEEIHTSPSAHNECAMSSGGEV